MKALLGIFAILLSTSAIAGSGSVSSSASGGCSETLDRYGYFYAYTYQFLYTFDGVAQSQSSSFSFSGFLAKNFPDLTEKDVVDYNERHVIYRRGDFDLAVPYVPGSNLYFRDNSREEFPEFPDDSKDHKRRSKWIKLCSY